MSSLRTLLVLGAGGHGKSVAEAALLSGEWQRVCFLDDRWPQLEVVCGIDVIGDLDSLLEPGLSVAGGIAAVGNNSLRKAWVERIKAAGIEVVSIVHPRAWISPSAHIGQGVAVLAMAVIGTDARLGQGAIVNAGAVVDHDVCVGDFAHLGAASIWLAVFRWELRHGCRPVVVQAMVLVLHQVMCCPGHRIASQIIRNEYDSPADRRSTSGTLAVTASTKAVFASGD